MQAMPITFMRDLTERIPGGDWYFCFIVTRQGSAVGEVRALDLSYETVLRGECQQPVLSVKTF